jgi:hypothetical protein
MPLLLGLSGISLTSTDCHLSAAACRGDECGRRVCGGGVGEREEGQEQEQEQEEEEEEEEEGAGRPTGRRQACWAGCEARQAS